MAITPTEVNALIRKRRAVFPKAYIQKPIEKTVLEEILENANWAPTHRLTEPWRFQVFQGKALEKLGTFLAKAYKESTPTDKYSDFKYNKTLKKPTQCGAVIAICMKRDAEERVPEWEEMCAVACAVQNIWLSASAYGIGGYWSTPKTALSEEMSAFLELGEGERCLGLFYMGYHEMPELPGKREPVAEKTIWRSE